MKRVLLLGTVTSLGLMTAAAGQGSLGLGLLAPDNRPYSYTGAGPGLLAPDGPNWKPSLTPPSNPHPYPCLRPGQEGLGSVPLEPVGADPSTPVRCPSLT